MTAVFAGYGPPKPPPNQRTRLRAAEAALDDIQDLCDARERQHATTSRPWSYFPVLVSVDAIHTILRKHGVQC